MPGPSRTLSHSGTDVPGVALSTKHSALSVEAMPELATSFPSGARSCVSQLNSLLPSVLRCAADDCSRARFCTSSRISTTPPRFSSSHDGSAPAPWNCFCPRFRIWLASMSKDTRLTRAPATAACLRSDDPDPIARVRRSSASSRGSPGYLRRMKPGKKRAMSSAYTRPVLPSVFSCVVTR